VGLEKMARIGYNPVVVDSYPEIPPEIDTSARYRGPRNWASRQELAGMDLEKHESSPRLAARDGMEQDPRDLGPEGKPYEFRFSTGITG